MLYRYILDTPVQESVSGKEKMVSEHPYSPPSGEPLRQDILEGGNLRNALQELQQIVITPIKYYSVSSAALMSSDAKAGDKDLTAEGFQSHNPPPCDGEPSATPISEGDIAGQFTRVMGKGEGLSLLRSSLLSGLVERP